MTQPTHHQIANFLIDHVISELVLYVMEDTHCTMEKAMELIYSSPIMPLLQDEEGELYVQSPAYIYEIYKEILEKTPTESTLSNKPQSIDV